MMAMPLGESESSSLVWLQSLDRAELALPLVSPRRFIPGYKVRISGDELTPLELSDDDLLFVLVTVAKTGTACTADLRGPLLFNATRRRGVQVVTLDDQPLQYVLRTTHKLEARTDFAAVCRPMSESSCSRAEAGAMRCSSKRCRRPSQAIRYWSIDSATGSKTFRVQGRTRSCWYCPDTVTRASSSAMTL